MKCRIGIEEASMAKTKTKKLDRRGNGSKKMKCTLCGQLGHNKRFHSSSKTHEDENQHGDGFGLGVSSRAHVGKHVAYSQPASSLSGIRQQKCQLLFHSLVAALDQEQGKISRLDKD
ncbi:Uncharacterized protein Fot_11018 [Forsythia ovata]|uniref:Uncharacterized protein n=1 Tax=Forsythia ovata TaxID=205694 RepID=A0ABD1WL65_9LAMI